ncbi:MAG: oligosaccharide flippase family protein [Chloroflexota bacterium]|nr:oligosaccharide flippase family protein [Chloroflexota bacterium]
MITPLQGEEARRAARNAAAIAAARIVSNGALLAWQLILGRLLGDAAFGVYGTVGGLIGVAAPLVAFGMSAILIRETARHPDRAGRYQAISLVVQTMLALVAYAALNGAAFALGYSDAIRAFAAVAALSLFIDLPGNLSYDLLLAREKMVWTSGVDIVHIAARVGLGAALLAAGWGLAGVYVATILTGIGRSTALWRLARRAGVRPTFPLDRTTARGLLIDAAPLAFASVLNMSYAYVDRLLTASLLTEADTGHLTAAFVIVYGVIDLLSTTILIALYPMMARAYTPNGDNTTFRFVVEKLAWFTLMLGVPLVALFAVYADAITLPLFGVDFAASADVLRALIAYAAVAMISNVFAQALIMQNRQRVTVTWRAIGFGIKLALSLALLPTVGVVGAALASVGAELLVLAMVARAFYSRDLTPRPTLHTGEGERTGLSFSRIDLNPQPPLRTGEGQIFALRSPSPNRSGGQAVRLALVGILTFGALLACAALNIAPLIGMIAGGLAYVGAVLGLRVLRDDDWDLLYRLAAALPGGAMVRRVWRRDVTVNW